MHEEWDYFIIRSKHDATDAWRYMCSTEGIVDWLLLAKDEQIIKYTRSEARDLVRNLLPKFKQQYLQIRPFECDVNDPRIEDYSIGIEVEKAPEILIIIAGGLIEEVQTTLPGLRVRVIDHDKGEVGDDPVRQWELPEGQCNALRAYLDQLCEEAVQEYQIGDDDDAYEWQL